MKRIIFILLLFSANPCMAQDKETQAQAYYMAAGTAYDNGSYPKVLEELNATETTLGNSNAKIKYLKVKCLLELKRYEEAKTELSKYFEYAKDSKGTDKYKEMTVLLGQIDDMQAIAKSDMELNAKIASVVSVIEFDYKQSYRPMQKEKWAKSTRVDSLRCYYGVLNCFYSGTSETPYLKEISLSNIEKISVKFDNGLAVYKVFVKYKDAEDIKIAFGSIDSKSQAEKLVQDLQDLITLSPKKK
jgi:tetratricopeptide (TPR) repeat protein